MRYSTNLSCSLQMGRFEDTVRNFGRTWDEHCEMAPCSRGADRAPSRCWLHACCSHRTLCTRGTSYGGLLSAPLSTALSSRSCHWNRSCPTALAGRAPMRSARAVLLAQKVTSVFCVFALGSFSCRSNFGASSVKEMVFAPSRIEEERMPLVDEKYYRWGWGGTRGRAVPGACAANVPWVRPACVVLRDGWMGGSHTWSRVWLHLCWRCWFGPSLFG